MRGILVPLMLAAGAAPALAQSEARLRGFFEGKSVRVKLEMPGAEEGVDVYPGSDRPIDFPRHATRLKRYGTALRRGEEVLITKIRLKGDHLEFQLGGGGYGTFGDDTSPSVYVPSAPKTEREKNLEKDLPQVTDPAQRRKLREELDALKRERQREDARNQAQAAQAQQMKEANIRQRRLEGGSRFNLRYPGAVPEEALTPEGIMRALEEYVDFSPLLEDRAPPLGRPQENRPTELRKGLTADEVDALLGRPEAITQRKEGSLTVSTSTYRTREGIVTAEFVEGVLIRFTIGSPEVGLDHIILASGRLDRAIEEFTRLTGVVPQRGGQHPGRGTENALVSLGPGHYLEILAPITPAPDTGRAARQTVRLMPSGWALHASDLSGVIAALRGAGISVAGPVPGSRRKPDGTLLQWQTAAAAGPGLELAPFFIQWDASSAHPSTTSPSGCRLLSFVLVEPSAGPLGKFFSAAGYQPTLRTVGPRGMRLTLECPRGQVSFPS